MKSPQNTMTYNSAVRKKKKDGGCMTYFNVIKKVKLTGLIAL